MKRALAAWWLAAALAAPGSAAAAQGIRFSGYYQNVGTVTGKIGTSGSALADLQRLRLMAAPVWGAVDGEVAVEHTLTWQGTGGAALAFGLLSSTRTGDDWLGIDWTIHDGRSVLWRQRVDRLDVGLSHGVWSLRAGRQAISWARRSFSPPPTRSSRSIRRTRSASTAAASTRCGRSGTPVRYRWWTL